jgi:hypothetical protein
LNASIRQVLSGVLVIRCCELLVILVYGVLRAIVTLGKPSPIFTLKLVKKIG